MKNKTRNLFLALVLIGVFAGLGFFFYKHWVVQKPFAIIVFLVPELDSANFAAARLYAGGAAHRFAMETWPGLLLMRQSVRDASVGDAAAVSSAIATGQPGRVGQLSTAAAGGTLPTLLQIARTQGRVIGLVGQERLTSPILAAFYAPGAEPTNREQISLALLETVRPEVMLGGGSADFLPDLKGGMRKDGRDLLLEARQSGYDIVRNRAELVSTPTWRAPRVLGLFSPAAMASDSLLPTTGEPGLSGMVTAAIQLLQFHRRGYFLLVDAALPGLAAERSDGESLLRDLVQLDRAVHAAQEFAGSNSLILVMGTLSRGGFCLNATSFPQDRGLAVLSPSVEGVPAVTWSTGPGRLAGSGPAEPVAFSSIRPAPRVADQLGFWKGPEGLSGPQGFQEHTVIFPWLQRQF